MSRMLIAGMLWLGLGACSSAVAREPVRRDADRWPLADRAMDRTLVAGTLIQATLHSSRRTTPGATLTATVSADVTNAHRAIVIPAGCLVGLRIARRGPAMLLEVTSVTVQGQVYPVSATAAAHGTRILFVLPEGFTAARRLGVTS